MNINYIFLKRNNPGEIANLFRTGKIDFDKYFSMDTSTGKLKQMNNWEKYMRAYSNSEAMFFLPKCNTSDKKVEGSNAFLLDEVNLKEVAGGLLSGEFYFLDYQDSFHVLSELEDFSVVAEFEYKVYKLS